MLSLFSSLFFLLVLRERVAKYKERKLWHQRHGCKSFLYFFSYIWSGQSLFHLYETLYPHMLKTWTIIAHLELLQGLEHLAHPLAYNRSSINLKHWIVPLKCMVLTGDWVTSGISQSCTASCCALHRVCLRKSVLIEFSGVAFLTYHKLVIADDFRYVFRACQPPRNRNNPLADRSH